MPCFFRGQNKAMKNPIKRNQQKKKIRRLVKKYMFFLLLSFAILVIHYKSGSGDSRWKTATYSKPTHNTWQYVYEHMSKIVCFSLCGGLFFTLVSELIQDD